MTKKIILIVGIFLKSFHSYCQDPSIINGFKYAYVDTLSKDPKDEQKLVQFLNESLEKKGIELLPNDINLFPEDALSDPCLIGRWTPDFNKTGVGFFIRNCENKIVYKNGSSLGTKENKIGYCEALKIAFKPIENMTFSFDSLKTPSIKYPTVEKINETESTLINYFDSNTVQDIEGIFESFQKEKFAFFRIGIKKINKKFVAVVLRANLKQWKPGDVLATFEFDIRKNQYVSQYYRYNKVQVKGNAIINEEGLLEVYYKDPYFNMQETRRKFKKIYPVIN